MAMPHINESCAIDGFALSGDQTTISDDRSFAQASTDRAAPSGDGGAKGFELTTDSAALTIDSV